MFFCQRKFWTVKVFLSTWSGENSFEFYGFEKHSMKQGDFVNYSEMTVLITALANSIACSLTNDELALLSSVLVQLGDTLVTISAMRNT